MSSGLAARILAKRLRAKHSFTTQAQPTTAAPLNYVPIILDPRFTAQNNFVEDKNPFISAQCSRRSGKSSGLGIRFSRTMAKYDGATCVYTALTGDSARDIMWPVMEELDEKYKIGFKFTPSRLTIQHPSGGKLRLYGADMKNFVRRLRGKKSPGIGVDEAQEFGTHLEYLVDDVLTPMMADFGLEAWLAICGTPGPIPRGYFYEVSKLKKHGFSSHEWTLFDNIYMPDPKGFVDSLILRKQWPANHPTLLREWRNQWVVDLEALWIKYKEDVNHFTELPKMATPWHYILGIDIGWKDADAFAVLAWNEFSPTTYLVHEDITTKQDITGLRLKIEELQKTYDFHKMVIDTGGLGKKITEELKNRYGIPLEAADKAKKQENAAFLNDALRMGLFKARAESQFASDSYVVQVDWDKSTPDRIVLKSEPHSDIIDAVLYAFKESPAYAYTPPKEQVLPGTPEWNKMQEEKHLQSALEQVKNEKNLREGKSEFGNWKKNKKGIPDWNSWE